MKAGFPGQVVVEAEVYVSQREERLCGSMGNAYHFYKTYAELRQLAPIGDLRIRLSIKLPPDPAVR